MKLSTIESALEFLIVSIFVLLFVLPFWAISKLMEWRDIDS